MTSLTTFDETLLRKIIGRSRCHYFLYRDRDGGFSIDLERYKPDISVLFMDSNSIKEIENVYDCHIDDIRFFSPPNSNIETLRISFHRHNVTYRTTKLPCGHDYAYDATLDIKQYLKPYYGFHECDICGYCYRISRNNMSGIRKELK